MNLKPIYLDYMSTTPIDPLVIDEMLKYMGPDSNFGNPSSSTHTYGREAAIAIENAREQLAQLVNADPSALIFTSGATESNNLALIGACQFYQHKGKHLITMQSEHKAVLDTFAYLESIGYSVTYLKPDINGNLDVQELIKSIKKDTILVSIMYANNEIGVIYNIKEIGEVLKSHGILFHVDAAQALGKISIDTSELHVDLMSFSAHKCYGPKGIGALYVRQKPRIRLQPISFGGGQEKSIRSGTLATHQIVGFGKASEIAKQVMATESVHLAKLRDKLWNGISHLECVQRNAHLSNHLPHHLHVTFKGINGESLQFALHELALSTSSACASKTYSPSHVLKSIGLTDQDALSSIRFSVGRFTTETEIDYAIELICKQVLRLQAMQPHVK